jgi:hypothetical protein
MTGAILIATISAGVYYLAARAGITRRLWSRYPRPVAAFLNCSACSGFWYALGLGYAASRMGLNTSVLGFPASGPIGPYLAACAAVGLVWTPIIAFAHAYAYSQLSDGNDEPYEDGPGAA